MAGIALKRSIRPCFHNGPSRGVIKKKYVQEKRILRQNWKKFILKNVNQTFSLVDLWFSIIYVGAIILTLAIFEEFIFDLMFETVDVLC